VITFTCSTIDFRPFQVAEHHETTANSTAKIMDEDALAGGDFYSVDPDADVVMAYDVLRLHNDAVTCW
jgi:hypothetical protein